VEPVVAEKDPQGCDLQEQKKQYVDKSSYKEKDITHARLCLQADNPVKLVPDMVYLMIKRRNSPLFHRKPGLEIF
jgi:hypothetical protein